VQIENVKNKPQRTFSVSSLSGAPFFVPLYFCYYVIELL
jgi:hypothetical protein